MLRQHPICCGATLSGQGEIVLVLDPHRLVQQAGQCCQSSVAPENALSAPPEPAPVRLRPKVLVVDDSKTARHRVVQSLSRYDVEVVQAADGLAALQLMKNQHFSAVFSDLEMPRFDGMQLLAKVHHNGHDHGPPVVIISSRSECEFKKDAAELGAARYLTKPLADNDLDQAIAAIPALHTLRLRQQPTSPSDGDLV
jgi:chemosensory pili system protein ChpA (sensor histidine kinase/response regulator)